jgi:cullin 3
VVLKRSEELYDRVIDFEKEWLRSHTKTQIMSVLSADLLSPISTASTVERRTAGERFLKALKQQWQDHETCICMLGDVTMYLDRVYCIDNGKPSIYAAGMQSFRDIVLRASTSSQSPELATVLTVVVETMLDHVRMEREGDSIDKSMLKACSRMLESMYVAQVETDDQRLYDACFEPLFLEKSHVFYESEAEKMLRDSDAGSYCRKTKKRLTEERDRCGTTLSESTIGKIEKVLVDQLITKKLKEIIEMETGVAFMIENDRLDELELMFELSAKIDSDKLSPAELTELRRAIHKSIVQMGTAINDAAMSSSGDGNVANQATMSALKWVEEVLALKDKFDRIWERAFSRNNVLQTAITKALSEFINSLKFTRASEYVSLFIDDHMKKGIKDKTDAEVDIVLDKAITLLRYISDKDMFERYYKKHLSRRLLMQKSISMDVEKQMTGKMKLELGNSFTGRIEAMFKDMTLSEELTAGFKAHRSAIHGGFGAAPTSREIELHISILTAMTWPQDMLGSSSDENAAKRLINYPKELDRLKDSFTRFYNSKHSGRVLTWQPAMGTADVKARFPGATKDRLHELNVSTYAMVILLLFNDLANGEHMTTLQIQELTNIPRHDLDRNLQSLAVAPKTRVLKKEPMSKEIGDNDKFFFNTGFTSKFTRVKVGVVASGNKVESERERLRTEKKNDENRGFVCEAALVRIMK